MSVDFRTALQHYFAAWNASTGPDDLAKAVAVAFTEDVAYTDPGTEVRGHAEVAEMIAGAHAQFPGFEFRLHGEPDGHHDIVRFGWELVSLADGSAPVAGFDVATVEEDGRVSSVKGFLDRVPGA
ncbi:nuclear transport factor 2 family protein [Streptomyces sp. NBC_00237]|uniref:nuclear transport factor 2 family protein n=1 Tax=Streptomyces sp. NBC_00237 TaxID=2975687 RepID=UPI002250559E|nr:nuclear transport factor 2 family protein [Streptomyces sp. NBC_00237]MCX5202360.1 nuclear transport factor 2 family protein [Streptomyces sp. NBC_00237]